MFLRMVLVGKFDPQLLHLHLLPTATRVSPASAEGGCRGGEGAETFKLVARARA